MSVSRKQSIRSLIHGAWEATRGERPRFLGCILLFLFAYTIDLLGPWAIGYTLGVFVKEGFNAESYNASLWGIGAYVGLRLIYNVCHHLGRYYQLTVAYSARMNTLEKLFTTILSFPLSWHVKHHSGESLSKLHRSIGAVDQTISTYVWQIIEGVVKVVFASIALVALDFWVSVNVAAMIVLTVIVMITFNKRLVQSIRNNNAFMDRLNRICVDHLFNVITIKSLGLERGSQAHLLEQRGEGYKLNKHIVRFSELKWGSVGIGYSLVIGSSLLIYFSGHRELGGAFDVAQVYVLLNYLDRVFQAVGSFTAYYSGIIESATAYEDATKISDEAHVAVIPHAHQPLPRDWSTLDISGLTFTYSDESGEAMRDLSMSIRRGAKIALIGPSGAGKSTILKILGGLLIPEKATLQVNGGRSVTMDQVAQSSLIIPQEPEVFSENVRFNLTMGGQFTATELSFFVQLCKLEEVIEKLPQGWNSSLAESGANISVGEKQRLALARGLLRATGKDFLLLDEPTSSLDPTTEKQIFLGILHHFADRTVMTACHRLALVPLFDTIVFIRRGKVEEVGSFEELLKKRGPFYHTWTDYEEKLAKNSEG